MHTYGITVERDGRWWMITVPGIGQVTQARRLAEVEDMARSLIAISTDAPLTEIAVRISTITIPAVGDVWETARHFEGLREEARILESKVSDGTQQFARDLTSRGIPVRDVATLLQVSPQRVSQLAKR